jgi:hypothetical protein
MNTHMKKINFLLLVIIIGLASCNRAAELDKSYSGYASKAEYANDDMDRISEDIVQEEGNSNEMVSETPNSLGQKLIKRGNVSFETTQLDDTRKMLDGLNIKFNTYVSNENEYQSDERKTRSLSLRIPSKNFDAYVSELSQGVQYFDQKNISVEDVTSEFIDVTARIKTKKELEQRYISILSKANTVAEIIEIEREIGKLRADIESFEQRLKYLNEQVSYSTLHIDYYQVTGSRSNFWLKSFQSLQRGWNLMTNFILGILIFWPFLIAIGLFVVLLRRKMKK